MPCCVFKASRFKDLRLPIRAMSGASRNVGPSHHLPTGPLLNLHEVPAQRKGVLSRGPQAPALDLGPKPFFKVLKSLSALGFLSSALLFPGLLVCTSEREASALRMLFACSSHASEVVKVFLLGAEASHAQKLQCIVERLDGCDLERRAAAPRWLPRLWHCQVQPGSPESFAEASQKLLSR